MRSGTDFLMLIFATIIPPGQHFLMLGAVLFGSDSFKTQWYDWVLACFIPFYGWYKILFA